MLRQSLRSPRGLLLQTLLILPALAFAHGGVVEEDDLCVINIGYMKAHFKIYVPQQTGHRQYCEDIPVRGESVFVMEYQHDGLSDAALEFRIIENITGKGTFARLDDVQAITDIDSVTVGYRRPEVVGDVYTTLQDFETDGEYIGIVSATPPGGEPYTAVFPFAVGHTGYGIWPWIIGGLVILQLNYWLMSRRRIAAAVAIAGVIPLLAAPAMASDIASDNLRSTALGHFRVKVAPSLDPVPINRMHSWTLIVTNDNGSAVSEAVITLSGGMPAHDHGLPTAPRVIETIVRGTYRIEGLRFHMPGRWELRIRIKHDELDDALTLRFDLE